MFSGTETYCPSSTFGGKPAFGDGYKKGTCGSKNKGRTTRYGISPTMLKQFDGNYFCVKRDPELNYHVLSKLRAGGDCESGKICGAPNDKDRKFCLKSTQKCPLNALFTVRKGQSVNPEYKTEKAPMMNNWDGHKVFNH